MLQNQESAKLIYIGDPMCSWCYGISDELNQVYKNYDGNLEFEMVMGGLRPYNTQTMVELKEFLTHHWKDVSKASGKEFKYDILNDTKITYDTEPPSRATVVVRKLAPKKEYAFFKAIQEAFYCDNLNMHLSESYHKILQDLEIDKSKFDELFDSNEYKELVKADFERSASLGVRSFPTLVLQNKGETTLIASGFSKAKKMISRIDAKLK